MAIYLTHGAKKNVGDYLIHSRARKLCEHFLPEVDFVSIPRWEKGQSLDGADALVLCGGPGLTPRFVESVFPVVGDARKINLPLAGLALGWQGLPKRDSGSFSMTARSVAGLRRIASEGQPVSVRDDVTGEIAEQFGIETIRTGCTAWYSLPHMGQMPTKLHDEPRTVVYTTPAETANSRESVSVMRLLRRRFPAARLIASFHRGIRRDDLTPRKQSAHMVAQAAAARVFGFEVRDTSYDLSKIGFYREADLHVGYRVHAHLDFVSRRVPSLLISEDGRGYGQSVTLHGTKLVLWAGHPKLLGKLDRRLGLELRKGWPSLMRAVETIEENFPIMERFVVGLGRL